MVVLAAQETREARPGTYIYPPSPKFSWGKLWVSALDGALERALGGSLGLDGAQGIINIIITINLFRYFIFILKYKCHSSLTQC